jgi:predicted restriction endonuclease
MKQTVVELLIEQIKIKADNIPTNTKENRIVKGIYVDCLLMAKQSKEIEKQQQGYSEEEVKNLIEDWTKMEKGLNINFPFDKFNKWFEQFKKK